MFTGTYTAIATPFRNGAVDEPALKELVRRQIRGQVDGVVPVGTTGESPTVDATEHIRIIEVTVAAAKGSPLQVIAGTGANSTAEAIDLTRRAEAVGAHGSLQVAPYYNRPSQGGLFEHFQAIAAATKLPILLYSIPGRCGVEIGVDTCARLAAVCRNIVGIKEAGGNADRVSQLRAACGPKFTILSGDDALTLPFMSVGASGVISVASNVAPKQVVAMVRAFAAGDLKGALRRHEQLYPLFKDLFLESNPVPVKVALELLGVGTSEVRLPLVAMSSSNREILIATLKKVGLLK